MLRRSPEPGQYTSIRFTETLALEGLSASIGTVGDACGIAVAESVFGLFKNEAVAAGSPFRTGPLRTLADVEALTTDYVDWYKQPPPAQPARQRHPRRVRARLLCPRNRLTDRCGRQREDGMKAGTVQ